MKDDRSQVWGNRIPHNHPQMTSRKLAVAAALLAAAVLSALSTAPNAGAATGVKYGLTDDAWLENGPGSLESRLNKLDALGVRVVRFTLRWDKIAPTRPATATDPTDTAYDWSDTDPVLDGLRAHGIDVVLQILGTPGWANGASRSTTHRRARRASPRSRRPRHSSTRGSGAG